MGTDQILPQSGYMGPDYDEGGLLVLGKNPGGGDEPDPELYGYQTSISDAASLSRATPGIQALANKWLVLRNLQLLDLGIEPKRLAYANQVMCRSRFPAIRYLEESRPDVLDAIYDRCFSQRVAPLIRLLKPGHVIVVGQKADSQNSWPTRFSRSQSRHLPDFRGQVTGVPYPYGSHIARARAAVRAGLQLKR